jgi:FixJ family two-component response regulator
MRAQKQTIVVVEDDAGMARAIERLLRVAGFQPRCFSSAEALLASNAVRDAACLVVDVHLPGLSGFELYRRLAPSRDSVHVIFMTAHDEPATRDAARRLGCIAYLCKPFDAQSLLDAVRSAVQNSR